MADIDGEHFADLGRAGSGILEPTLGAFVELGAGIDGAAPVISNLTPAEGALAPTFQAARLTPISLDVTDIDPGLASVVIWCKFTGKEERLVVFDGAVFVKPFDSTLSARTTITNGFHFVVLYREPGWPDDIEELTVKGIDAAGNIV